ncbi:MAG: hypothetical protein EOO62_24500 [Hymenobacter sp.]|nr:MAG: hypothetical protein EOO62_24500 [Hymenobacter sp.]
MAAAAVFGHVGSARPGDLFASRAELAQRGQHRPLQAGICATQEQGAESIVLSDKYEDDEVHDDFILYTGHGGRSEESGQQVADQTLTKANKGLARSQVTGLPVRVFRKVGTAAGAQAFRYEGLFRVVSRDYRPGRSGHLVFLFRLEPLVTAAAKTGRVVNVKHGQFLAPENMKHPVKKIEESGNEQIILTERGFTFGYNDLVVDPRAFYHMARTGYPVVFDVTHAIRKYGIPSADAKGGAREYLPVLARAGVAAGVDGLFVETHTCPSEALCDAASQLDIKYLEEFLKPLLELHAVEVKYRNTMPELA